jgi:hypothetical protein
MLTLTIALFFAQVLNYGILTINFRAVAQGHMKTMVITDGMCATLMFFLIKRISEAAGDAIIPWMGYTLGGMVGSVVGMYISKKLHKENKKD